MVRPSRSSTMMALGRSLPGGMRRGVAPGFRMRLRIATWLTPLVAGAAAFVVLLPVFWMISTSFKQPSEIFSLPIQWLPHQLQFGNYASAWSEYNFTRYTINSVFVTTSVTAAQVLLASLAGFGLAKYKFFGRDVLLIAILSTIMLPVEVIMIPLYLSVHGLGWQNTYQGLIVPVIADAFGVFLMRQYMRRLPDEILEAARIDGASELRIFFQIVMPMSWPAIATLAIFVWRETWDDFVWPFIIVSDDAHRTVPLGIALFQQDYTTDYGQLMAVGVLATIPTALVFFLFQRAFIRGIALTGLKG